MSSISSQGCYPVPDPALYPKLVLPPDWNVTILSSAYQINTQLNSMMEDLKEDEDLYVGMDMEHGMFS